MNSRILILTASLLLITAYASTCFMTSQMASEAIPTFLGVASNKITNAILEIPTRDNALIVEQLKNIAFKEDTNSYEFSTLIETPAGIEVTYVPTPRKFQKLKFHYGLIEYYCFKLPDIQANIKKNESLISVSTVKISTSTNRNGK